MSFFSSSNVKEEEEEKTRHVRQDINESLRLSGFFLRYFD